ncbi:MAG: anti-sigma regulatory factor [Spirulinaceae cyanobacterium RM2_2_10]|nr:anti-sigma regulatory factor [Spirulinaceae cyanobacterium SM2_1_0]NJO19338.1 anti-sigma regulatory factor [Spirulinaceae cyanobacterium RM2_2_10]
MADERPRQFHLHLNTDLELLGYLLQQFEAFVWPHLCRQPTTYSPARGQELYWQCQIALAEGFTNAVRHAHRTLPTLTPIDIEIQLWSDYLEMRIGDRGAPFDLRSRLYAALQEGENADREGGRGLRWMSQLMDTIDYVRTADGRNILILGKRLGAGDR